MIASRMNRQRCSNSDSDVAVTPSVPTSTRWPRTGIATASATPTTIAPSAPCSAPTYRRDRGPRAGLRDGRPAGRRPAEVAAWASTSRRAWSRRHAANIPHLEFLEADAIFFDTDERFDRILINNLLEYVEDIQGLLRNCRRLLKPRGRAPDQHPQPAVDPAVAGRRAARSVHSRHPTQLRHRPGRGQSAGPERLRGREADAPDARCRRRSPCSRSLVNLVAAQTPWSGDLCMTEFVVARPAAAADGDYSVSVVVPCYNEAGNIEECVRRVPRMGRHTEVIVVDDGSQDGTAELVKPELNPAVEVRCISYQPNRGKLQRRARPASRPPAATS